MKSQYFLAEMLHDQDRDLAAAKVLEKLVKSTDSDGLIKQKASQMDHIAPPDSLSARVHYYYACHWAAQHDLKQQWQQLDIALEKDPTDEDVLIDLYRSSTGDTARHDKAKELIKDMAEKFRAQ